MKARSNIRLTLSAMSAIPKLASVIIPTFNRARLLEQTVASVLAQDYPHKQIVVIDDGSTDDTAARMKRLPEVEFFAQKNAGPSAARNHGMRQSRGEFIVFLDSDDLWDPNFLSECVAGLETLGAGFVFSNWRGVLEDGSPDYPDYLSTHPYLGRPDAPVTKDWQVLTAEKARTLLLRNSIALPSGTLMRRDVIRCDFDEVAGMAPGGEDRLFLIDAIFHSQCKVAFTERILWSHRLHRANFYVGNPDVGKTSERDILAKEAILKKYGDRLTAAEKGGLLRSIAGNYFDWGYHESCGGHRGKAVGYYFQSLSRSPSPKTALAILKALLKPKLPA